ncbi:MAG: hypothetical protein AAF387_10405 [Pseudomonadota bacterium]
MMVSRCVVSVSAALTMTLVTSVVNANNHPNQSEERVVAQHAASCAAYFFSAANAKGVAEYERYYGAGEYSFNLAVSLIGESVSLSDFNVASKNINQLMERRWSEFHKVDSEYSDRCHKLLNVFDKLSKAE